MATDYFGLTIPFLEHIGVEPVSNENGRCASTESPAPPATLSGFRGSPPRTSAVLPALAAAHD